MAATRAVAPFNKFEINVILIRLEDVWKGKGGNACGRMGGTSTLRESQPQNAK